jgi:hypothetical protein
MGKILSLSRSSTDWIAGDRLGSGSAMTGIYFINSELAKFN